jgi:TatD DNase family protein
MIDTHCHLNIMVNKQPEDLLVADHLDEIALIISRAQSAGIKKMICVGTSIPESRNCIAIAMRHSVVHATIGVHPCDIIQPIDLLITELEAMLIQYRAHIVAIGEIGLDYYHKPFDSEQQKKMFVAQLELAKKYDLPVVIHIREAGEDALAILENYKNCLRGVIHCFSLDKGAAEKIIGWGWYIGIDGPVTYPKNSGLRELIATVPLEAIVLETDAPFLPPQGLRGKPNCPSNLGIIAAEIASSRGISIIEVIEKTTTNAVTLFGLNFLA